MSRKEYINLIEENGLIIERLMSKVYQHPSRQVGYSRQQMMILVDLFVFGSSRLKEIAGRECISTPNLCIMFKKLESAGLVARTTNVADRRNTWYSLTPGGRKIVNRFKDIVLDTIETLCRNLTTAEEKKLTECVAYINKILTRVEEQNV